MKKEYRYSIIVVLLLLVITIIGTTFAYFSAIATSNNSIVGASSQKYEIIYRGGTEINGNIKMLSNHENADNTTVEIGLAQGVTTSINATLFITVENISEALATNAFKWEVYQIDGQNEILKNSGNFLNAKVGDEISILTIPLSTTITSYKVYFWADGSSSGNEINGSTFKGYIGAKTDVLTGIVDNS